MKTKTTYLRPIKPDPFCQTFRRSAGFHTHLVTSALKSTALGVLVLVITLSAHAQQANSNAVALAVPANKSDNDSYRIGPGDVLDVRIFNRPQLSRDAVRVDSRGMIRMPMIDNEIRAGCRTESELSEEIAMRYLKYQRHPQVDVFIKEYSSKPVAVLGAVEKPGQFQLQRRVRLLELVSLAGGPTERAGQRILVAHTAEISRCTESATESASGFDTFDLNNTLKAESIANPYVHAGDIISVPEAQQVFVVGNVFRPTSIPLKERVTVSQAVAMAGGTMPDTRKESIRVLRQLPGSTSKTEIIVNLNAISKRKADDLELMPNDIIDVPTAAGKRLLRGILSAMVPTASVPLRIVR